MVEVYLVKDCKELKERGMITESTMSSTWSLLFTSHQFEVVHLLQLGKDEFAAHVRHLHLQVVDLHLLDVNVAFDIVFGAFCFDPPATDSNSLEYREDKVSFVSQRPHEVRASYHVKMHGDLALKFFKF